MQHVIEAASTVPATAKQEADSSGPRAWTWVEAARYIQEEAGLHFDPDVARVFLKGRANIEI